MRQITANGPRPSTIGYSCLVLSASMTLASWWASWLWLIPGSLPLLLLTWHRRGLIRDAQRLQISWQLPSQVVAQRASLYGLMVKSQASRGLRLAWSDEQGNRLLNNYNSTLLWQRRRFGKRGYQSVSDQLPPLLLSDLLGLWQLKHSLPPAAVTVLPIVGTVKDSPFSLPKDQEQGHQMGQEETANPTVFALLNMVIASSIFTGDSVPA